MFDVDAFVADCDAALGEGRPAQAVKEVVERAIADPGGVAAALGARPGVAVLHRSDRLTIATVTVPARTPRSLPHDHRMWAIVGVYAGQEDNEFFRRADQGLTPSGGRSVRASETLAMGAETVHAIVNPSTHAALAALHVYGGDLVATARSMWTGPDHHEEPYDDTRAIGARIRT